MSWHTEEPRDTRSEMLNEEIDMDTFRCSVCNKWLSSNDVVFVNPKTNKYDERNGKPYCFTHDPLKK